MTSRGSSRGSARFSRLRLTKSQEDNAKSKPSASISKYFTKIREQPSEISVTPYSTSLSEIKMVILNDDDSDFKSPKPVKKLAKIFNKAEKCVETPPPKRKYVKKKQSIESNLIQKTLKDNFSDTNTMHLQIALALSKSVNEVGDEAPCFPSTQQVRDNARHTLEQFGFKSKSQPNTEIVKRKRKPRFKSQTPMILIRSQEERQELINEKVSFILNECFNAEPNYNQPETFDLNSDHLIKYCKKTDKLFHINNIEVQQFYIKSLPLSPTKLICGNLLKKWEEIPGRELSPVRFVENTKLNETVADEMKSDQICTNKSITSNTKEIDSLCDLKVISKRLVRSPSPDLFDSDEECSQKNDEINNFDLENNTVIENAKDMNPIDLGNESINFTKVDEASTVNLTQIDEASKMECSTMLKSIDCNEFQSNLNSSDVMTNTMSESSFIKNNIFDRTIGNCAEEYNLNELDNRNCAEEDNFNELDNRTDLVEREEIKSKIELSFDGKTNYHKQSPTKLESNFSLLSNLQELNTSDELKNEVFKTDNGICHFESFCDDGANLMVDLTESPDETDNEKENEDKRTKLSTFDESELNITSHVLNLLNGKSFLKKTVDESICISDEEEMIDSKTLNFVAIEPPASIQKSDRKVRKTFKKYATIGSNRDSILLSDDEFPRIPLKKYDSFGAISEQYGFTPIHKANSSISLSDDEFELSSNNQIKKHNSINSNSQESICISDEELNYSSIYSTPAHKKTKSNEHLPIQYQETNGVDEHIANRTDNFLMHPRIRDLSSKQNKLFEDTFANLLEQTNVIDNLERQAAATTPDKKLSGLLTETPGGSMLIKTECVTPIPDYDGMRTPEIVEELSKFGLKKLKRRRGVDMLKYIYESTHPSLEHRRKVGGDEDETKRAVKRRRRLIDEVDEDPPPQQNGDVEKELVCFVDESGTKNVNGIEIVGDLLFESEKDLIFERKQLKKVHSCRLPLHIAWHNMVSSNLVLQENILLYEPLQVEDLYAMLKGEGFKYHIQDLITFLDQKCITFRIAQKQGSSQTKRH